MRVWKKFLRFLQKGAGGRRHLSHCLDVMLIVAWLAAMALQGASAKMMWFGIACFRHFNRVQTWALIAPAFNPRKMKPDWGLLDENFSCAARLMKPFSRPAIWKRPARAAGETVGHNALQFLRELWKSKTVWKIAAFFGRRVETAEEFQALDLLYDDLQHEFPGVLGIYKRKNHYDIWVQAGALRKSSLCSYPVADKTGTSLALKQLYKIPERRAVPHCVLTNLLMHSLHQLKVSSAYVGKCDSLASMSMNLCFWHASCSSYAFNGKLINGLERHVAVQEREVVELMAELREADLEWDIGLDKI